MKKVIYFLLIISYLLFITACNKKNKEKEEDVEYYDNDGYPLSFPVYNSDIITDQKYTIEKASSHIFKEFNTQWVYPNMNDFLNVLGITNNAKINKRTIENFYQTLEGSINEYVIETEKYNLTIMNFSTIPDKYYLSSIEVNIIDNNYINLFPYTDIKDFQKDSNFGNKMDIPGRNDILSYAMRYGDDEYLGYSDLKFKNGSLDAICIRMYWP